MALLLEEGSSSPENMQQALRAAPVTEIKCLEIGSAYLRCIELINISASTSWNLISDFSEFKNNTETREIVPKTKYAVLSTGHVCHYSHLLHLMYGRTI